MDVRSSKVASVWVSDARLERWAPLVAEYVDCGVVVHAPDTSIVFANPKAAEMLGLSKDELSGKIAVDPAFRLLDLDGSALPIERYPAVMAINDPSHPIRDYEVGALHAKSGAASWGRVSAFPVLDEAGEFEAVVVTFIDITSLRETQAHLFESKQRYELAVAGTSDGIWDYDCASTKMYYAPRFEALLGLEAGALGQDLERLAALVHPDDRARVGDAWSAQLDRGEAFDITFRCRHANDSWRTFRATGAATQDEEGHVVRVTGAMRDITGRQRAAEERRALREKLHETQRLESLAVLAGGVAHDFNNLLVGVLTAADVARERTDDPELTRLLDICSESASRAADLTRQLMAYAGRAQLLLERVNPNEVAEELARLVTGSLAGRARLELQLAPDVAAVLVDPTQLRQVLLNLLFNAADAVAERPAGTVTLTISQSEFDAASLARLVPERPPDAGAFVVFEVRDDGVGMDAETKARIFEPFFTTKASGHGLGLAAVHGMVRGHGGFVRLESELGVGTTFEVGFPAAPHLPPATPKIVPRSDSQTHRLGRALVVDDEPAVRAVLDQLLRRDGFEVSELADGLSLLEAIESTSFDVVFLDVSLPGQSGTELEKRLREAHPNLPVILMSGHVEAEDRIELAPHGHTVFLAKPFRISTVRDLLGQLLD